MKVIWLHPLKRLEVLTPQVDDGGYDLVLEANSVVRHVQLKTTFSGSKVNRFNINTGLSLRPSGCIVVVIFKSENLELESFLWFGAAPRHKLPDLDNYPKAKHTRGNARGVKKERPQIRSIHRSAFEKVDSIPALAKKLFGEIDKKAG